MLEKSYLVPHRKGQLLSHNDINAHAIDGHKFELYDGKPFSPENTYQEDRMLIMLLYSVGLERVVNELLVEESKKELFQLLKSNVNIRVSKNEKLSLLRELILKDEAIIEEFNEEEGEDYFDCIEIFLQSIDKTIIEASLATRFLIIKKAKERRFLETDFEL